jgi:TIR domain-containing protein
MTVAAKHVFVSHIHEEAALGGVVKGLIEEVFTRDEVRAFLSSDMRDLPAGRKWLDEVQGQLALSRVIVSLISPISLRRPWVNIELGAGWSKGLRVIPLCHSGQRVDDLPPPLGLFMGIGLDQSDAAERLLVGIADGLGLGHPGKRLNFEAMLKDMRTAALGVKASRAVQVAPPEDREGNDLEPEQVRILQALASAKNQGADIQLADLPSVAKIKPAPFTHYIDHLHKWQFIYIDRYTTGDDEVRLLPKGSKWLLDRNAMPD